MKYKKNLSCKTKQESVGSTNSPCGINRRRSFRQRIAPVEYWNGAIVKYDDNGTLLGIEIDSPGTSKSDLNTKQLGRKRRSSSSVVRHKVGTKRRTQSDGKDSNSNPSDFNRKRKKSSDINFSDIIISEHRSMDEYPPTKQNRLLSEMEPLGEFLASFCMEEDVFNAVLSDSIAY